MIQNNSNLFGLSVIAITRIDPISSRAIAVEFQSRN